MTEKDITFGINLKALRKKNGLTRASLAEKISYSEKSIEKWETGKSVPPVSTVCKLAQLFGVSVDSLVLTQNVTVKYLLGIDGGGTKTDFLLTDLNGNEIKRIILGPSNPVSTGTDNMKKCLEQGINRVCGDIDKREISLFAGIAGGISGNNKEIINKFLSSFGFGKFNNASDTDSALEIALSGENGVAVIIGTGIVAFCQIDGKRHRIGGWGYLIDKGGSGFHLGADALNSALQFIDGRGGSEMILQMIEKKLNKPLPDSISEIYQGGNAYIASFSSVVFDAFEKDDKEAEKILDRNACEIARIIETGYDLLKGKKGKIVLCGGLCQREEILKPFLKNHLRKEIRFEFSDKDMVNGAISLARKNIDK